LIIPDYAHMYFITSYIIPKQKKNRSQILSLIIQVNILTTKIYAQNAIFCCLNLGLSNPYKNPLKLY